MRVVWLVGLIVLLVGCKSSRSTSGANSAYSTYQEELVSSLPQSPDYETELEANKSNTSSASVQTVDKELEEVQKRLIEKNKSEPYFSGFTVLVYSGVDRNQAFKTRDDMFKYFPDMTAEMQYQQPRYLVKVGKFAYKIEAQKTFSEIKTQFPTARIIQDRFQRKEFSSPQEIENVEGQN